MKGPLVRLGLLVFLFLRFSGSVCAATYYIDCAAGSDANSGTSTSTPWKHVPYMYTSRTGASIFTGSYTHSAGDRFIFKGGVTCGATSLGFGSIFMQAGGSSSATDYYGVDKTWFTGASWTQPIIDMQTTMTDWYGNGQNYFTIDNLEFTGFYWTGNPNSTLVNYIGLGGGNNIIIENCTFTGWTHDTYANNTFDDFNAIDGAAASPWNDPLTVTNNTCFQNSSAGSSDSGTCVYVFGKAKATYNHAYNMTSGIVGPGDSTGTAVIAYNTVGPFVASFDPTEHDDNLYPFDCANVHDNVSFNAAIVPVFVEAYGGCTAYFYNNVLWNPPTVQAGLTIDNYATGNDASTTTVYIWNNTIETNSGASQACIRVQNRNSSGSQVWGTIVLENNHCISEDTTAEYSVDSGVTITTFTHDHELLQTHASASAAGYTSIQTYAFSPTSASSPTVGVGTNLTSNCSSSILLCSDTIYGTVSRSVNARPSSGSWNIGAFEFGNLAQPPPPTLLQAGVH